MKGDLFFIQNNLSYSRNGNLWQFLPSSSSSSHLLALLCTPSHCVCFGFFVFHISLHFTPNYPAGNRLAPLFVLLFLLKSLDLLLFSASSDIAMPFKMCEMLAAEERQKSTAKRANNHQKFTTLRAPSGRPKMAMQVVYFSRVWSRKILQNIWRKCMLSKVENSGKDFYSWQYHDQGNDSLRIKGILSL